MQYLEKIPNSCQSPGRLIHSLRGGGEHYCGFTALSKQIGTPDASAEDSDYVKEHKPLKYLRQKDSPLFARLSSPLVS